MVEAGEAEVRITEKVVDELPHRVNETHTALTRREFVLPDQVRPEERYVWRMHSGKPSWGYSRLAFAVAEKKRADRERGLRKIEREAGNFLRVFQASTSEVGEDFRMSRKDDMATIQTWARACETMYVRTAYKRKDKKVRPVDLGESDGSKPGGSANWKNDVRKGEESRYTFDPADKYSEFLVPRFSGMKRGSRLTPERLKRIRIGEGLSEQEKELLTEMLYRREACLSWDFSEIGQVRPEVTPPVEIRTIPHKAWQVPGFQIPRSLNDVVAEMIKERLRNKILEPCYGPYRNPWFLVKKKEPGKYRLVNAALEMNKVTIRDANLPPSVDDFSEQFSGCMMSSLVDLFSGYDQFPLAETSRDLTAFQTPVGLVRMTTLPQGATNSIAQFMRIITRILMDHIPRIALPFMDDIGVKGPFDTPANREEVLPGIRRGALEHIRWLDGVLADIERAGCTISPDKSQFCCAGIRIVGFICDGDGRHPDTVKVIKIVEWPPCSSPTEARGFIGVCVYYRIFIEDFALISAPIYRLLKKNVIFIWGPEQQEAMDILKMKLVNPPALIAIDYGSGEEVILAVDASKIGWGGVLMQLRNKKRHPSRYESGMWSVAETKYDATKRECRGVLKCLKKFRYYLYGIRFVLETDAEVLVAQLNRSGTDLPGALVTRWIAWIRLFDFDVRHVKGKKHTAADGLSRRPHTQQEQEEIAREVDIDEWIEAELGSLRMYPATLTDEGRVLEESYSEKSEEIAKYLLTLRKPPGMGTKEFRKWRKEALKYKVQDRHLFRRNTKNIPLRRVIDDIKEQEEIMISLHDETGHRGREGTYRRIADRYWWTHMYEEVRNYVKSCERCQLRDPSREEEALHPTWVSFLWEKVAVDVVHMPMDHGKNFLVVARDDLSGWVEAEPLTSADSEKVANFLWKDVICRHGCFGKLVVDGGPENRGWVAKLAEKYGDKRVVVSAYHPQANGMVERGHKPLTDALCKMSAGSSEGWVQHLPAVLWADRSTIRASTGKTPYFLLCGSEPVLPIEMKYPTWKILPWDEVESTSDLIAMRARQLERRDVDLAEAADMVRRLREQGKELFDDAHSTRDKEIRQGDMVLLHDTQHEKDKSSRRKLNYKWKGPYRVIEAIADKGTYLLSELDGAGLNGTFAGNRLKKFHVRADRTASSGAHPRIEELADDESETDHQAETDSPAYDQEDLIPPGWPLAVIVPPPLRPD